MYHLLDELLLDELSYLPRFPLKLSLSFIFLEGVYE